MESESASSLTSTGSRTGDLVVIAAFVALMLVSAPFLRVYYRITSFETQWVRIEANGERSAVAAPADLKIAEYWNRKPEALLPLIERSFRKAVADLQDSGERQARYQLIVRYSYNSPRRDRTVAWQAP
jgi:hypothetical protein